MHCQFQEFLFIVRTKVQIEKNSYPIYKIYKTLNKQFESTLLLGSCFSINYINEFAVWNLVLDWSYLFVVFFYPPSISTLVSHYLFYNFFFDTRAPLNNYLALIVFCLTPHYRIVTIHRMQTKSKRDEDIA